MRCHTFDPQFMNRNLRSIGAMGYVFTAYFSTLPLNVSRNPKKKNDECLRVNMSSISVFCVDFIQLVSYISSNQSKQ